MSQVLAICNETPLAPEPSNNIQRNDNNFIQLYEKEKQKILLNAMLPFFSQAFFSVPLNISFDADDMVNKIERYSSINSDRHPEHVKPVRPSDIREPGKEDGKHAVSSKDTVTQAPPQQARPANYAVNRVFAGELELTPEFYTILINSKNKVSSLGKIDVDDLIAQIKNKIKFLQDNGRVELSMELKPGNMGTMLMSITSNKGVISINIFADQAAKEALEENIGELERSLKLANLNVDKLSIYPEENGKQYRGARG